MKWQRILGWWKESSISIWHLIWHSIWQFFWHSFWHFIWQSIWHPIPGILCDMAYLLLQALVAARWSQRSRGPSFPVDRQTYLYVYKCMYIYIFIFTHMYTSVYSIWHLIWHSIWQFFWHSFGITRNQWHIMVYNVKCPMKWQRILGWWKESSISIWHLIWHSIWQFFWFSFWHFIWQSIWHPTWHSLWYGLFAVASSCSGQMITEVEGSIWYRFGADLVQIWWCWDTKESFWVINWSKEGMLRWEARGIKPLSWWRNQWHIMVYNVKCPMKWQRILGWWKESSISIWHLIWHSIWQFFWHSFWHFIWQSIWHPIPGILCDYGLFAVASSCSGQMITEVEGTIVPCRSANLSICV